MPTLTPLSEVEMLFGSLEMWALVHCYSVELGLSSQRNVTKRYFRCKCMAFDTFPHFLIKLATIGCPKGCVAKIATNYQY